MISELDIWRAANLMIGRHGVDAELQAARMACAMLDRGDIEGQRVWQRIRRAIMELQAPLKGKPN
jgi:hypothetical protein